MQRQTFAPANYRIDLPAIIEGSAPVAPVQKELEPTEIHVMEPSSLRGGYAARLE